MGTSLDHLGIDVELEDGDLIASAVLISKIIKPDGTVAIAISDSDGMSWVEQLGLIAAAREIISATSHFDEDD
ncbi:hypothetical protein ABZ799_01385 [Nocardiopsis dassonvillei]|uniref:hypothetical protein n=1 Tax=Nocardiopsis dassonvillei TaxID=2014 RepID=UPI0033C7D1E6